MKTKLLATENFFQLFSILFFSFFLSPFELRSPPSYRLLVHTNSVRRIWVTLRNPHSISASRLPVWLACSILIHPSRFPPIALATNGTL